MSEDCRISAAEERTWDAATLAFRLLDQRVERDVQQEADLPLTYYELLVLLSKDEHRSLRMSELAERTHTRPSRITHAVRKLTEAGYVERVHCETDRRSWFASLTPQGQEVLDRAWVPHVRSIRENLLDVLSEEQRAQLLDISRTLLSRLAPGNVLAKQETRPEPGAQGGSMAQQDGPGTRPGSADQAAASA